MTAGHPLPETKPEFKPATATRGAGSSERECVVKVGGDWRLSEPVPAWGKVLGTQATADVRVVTDDLGKWDTSLVLFLVHVRKWAWPDVCGE